MPERPDLTARQREVLSVIRAQYTATGEAVACADIARAVGLSPSSVRQHLLALYLRGRLIHSGSPSAPIEAHD